MKVDDDAPFDGDGEPVVRLWQGWRNFLYITFTTDHKYMDIQDLIIKSQVVELAVLVA